MNWFYNLNIGAKLRVSFLLIALITGVMGYFSISNIKTLNNNDTELFEKMTEPVGWIGEISTYFQRIRVNTREILMSKDQNEKQNYADAIRTWRDSVTVLTDKFEKRIVSPEMKSAFAEFTTSRIAYGKGLDKLVNLAMTKREEEGFAFIKTGLKETAMAEMSAITKIFQLAESEARQRSDYNTTIADKTTTLMIVIMIAVILIAIGLGSLLSKIIKKPINTLTEVAGKVAMGDVDVEVQQTSTDEIGNLIGVFKQMIDNIKLQVNVAEKISEGNLTVEVDVRSEKDVLNKSFVKVIATLKDLVNETNLLSNAAVEGKLSIRGNDNKFNGGYKNIIKGVNNTLDAVISPLNMAAEYIDRISKGDIPAKITDNYNGDFNEIKINLNTCIEAINTLIVDANTLSQTAIEGKLSVRADEAKHQGDFRRIIHGVNNTLDSVIGPLNVAAEYVDRIAKGDIPVKISENYKGDFNEIKNNLNTCIDAINALVEDTYMLSSSVLEGKLSVRADATKHQGDFRKVVDGINATVNAVTIPLNKASEYIDFIGKGEIPGKISEDYKGDFNRIKISLNNCIDGLQGLTEAESILHKMANNDYSSKVNGNYTGIYSNIAESVNNLMFKINHVINVAEEISNGDLHQLEDLKKIGSRSENDRLVPSFVHMMTNIRRLVTDVNNLTISAAKGDLSTRADSAKHSGDYKKVIEGVNSTLDAVVNPLKISAKYMDRIAKGDIPEMITDNYQGDFDAIKNNINTCIEAIKLLITDTKMLSVAAVEGKLSVRAKAENHKGDFKTIIEGINQTLDSLMIPINEGVEILSVMASGDLTNRINSDYKGDHQLIKNSINKVAESLSKALGEVSEAIEATASASNQISSSTEEMAAGAQEQTQQTSEVASGVEEMSKTIFENTKNASFATDAAKDAGLKAKEGGQVVRDTIEGMNKIADVVKKSANTVQELGKSSDQIGEIVQVIDDIADQTNLLALNAAIEAARAGEQGRGFAVVADEVRKLAERTTKATKEIAVMIRQIQKDTSEAVHSMSEGTTEVERGKTLASKAGQALIEIVDGSQKVVDIVAQVAAASEQQSTAAEQISRNLEAISSVSQQSAAGTQQIAHAAEDLNRLTLNLESLISRFKVDNSSKRLNSGNMNARNIGPGKTHGYLA